MSKGEGLYACLAKRKLAIEVRNRTFLSLSKRWQNPMVLRSKPVPQGTRNHGHSRQDSHKRVKSERSRPRPGPLPGPSLTYSSRFALNEAGSPSLILSASSFSYLLRGVQGANRMGSLQHTENRPIRNFSMAKSMAKRYFGGANYL